MLRTHQVTGLGPVQADGSVDIFTVLPMPLHVTADWITAQGRLPAVGDDIVDDGITLTLAMTDAEALAAPVLPPPAPVVPATPTDAAAALATPTPDDTQKKTDGGVASPDGSSANGLAPQPLESPAPVDAGAIPTQATTSPPTLTVTSGVDTQPASPSTQEQINSMFEARIARIEKFLQSNGIDLTKFG